MEDLREQIMLIVSRMTEKEMFSLLKLLNKLFS